MRKINKIISLTFIFLICITIKSYAGSFGISVSPSSAEPGSTVTVRITGNNATGRIDVKGSNIQLGQGYVWVENNTQTITGKLTGNDGQTATVTASAISLADSTTADDIKGSKSASVAIKKKETVVETKSQLAASVQQTPAQQTQAKPLQTQTTRKTETNNQKNNTKQENNSQKEVPKENNIEDQGTKAEFGISSLYLFGVKDNDEKTEVKFTPEFNINVGEYSCTVESTIKKLLIDFDANEYKDLVKVDGIDKELTSGENVINIGMKNTDGTEKNYKIVVTKEAGAVEENKPIEENEQDKNEEKVNNENKTSKKEKKYIKMPVLAFVLMIIGIVVGEAVIIFVGYNLCNKKKNKSKHSKTIG